MREKTLFSMMLWVFGVSLAIAQSPYPEQRPLDLRVTGAFLPTDQQKRDDIVTVDVSVQGKPMLLRIGEVESLRDTFSEACFVLVDSVDPMPRSLLRGSSLALKR